MSPATIIDVSIDGGTQTDRRRHPAGERADKGGRIWLYLRAYCDQLAAVLVAQMDPRGVSEDGKKHAFVAVTVSRTMST